MGRGGNAKEPDRSKNYFKTGTWENASINMRLMHVLENRNMVALYHNGVRTGRKMMDPVLSLEDEV